MPDIVCDALGIAQFLTKSRGEEAINYLLAIERLTFENWKEGKELLPLPPAQQRNRHTKEGYIKDIVTYFIDNPTENRYLVADLAICPGFQPHALELISYSAGTLHAVKHLANNIANNSNTSKVIDTSPASIAENAVPASTAPSSNTDSKPKSKVNPPYNEVAGRRNKPKTLSNKSSDRNP